ncbi:hypothetical protein KGY73_08310 [bacterium]|nr:hypothetical protein [bacterium]
MIREKRMIVGGAVFLVVLLMGGIFLPLQAVTTEECMDAYEECMELYGSLPFPADAHGTVYCATGLSFCILFM